MVANDITSRSRRLPTVGTALILLGLAALAVLAFVSAWPDMESSVFDASTALMADEALSGLRCPTLVTVDERASIGAVFHNPTRREQTFLVRIRISQGFVSLWRQDSRTVTLAPGQTRHLAWPITARDAAYGRLIMARVLAMSSADLAARQGHCGVLVLGLRGVAGRYVFGAGLAAAAACLVAGGLAWSTGRRPLRGRRLQAARAVGVVVAILVGSLVCGLHGWWMASHLLLLLAVLVPVAALERLSGA